jgi:hypothetical protein
MPIIYKKKEIEAQYIVQNPEPGNWTAVIEAKNVSSTGEDYIFFVVQLLGNVTIADNEMVSSDSSNSVNQTNT